jgi:hypothetical protein
MTKITIILVALLSLVGCAAHVEQDTTEPEHMFVDQATCTIGPVPGGPGACTEVRYYCASDTVSFRTRSGTVFECSSKNTDDCAAACHELPDGS